MNTLQSLNTVNPNITHVEDNSDAFMRRALIHFTNGYKLSVIHGMGSYGSRSNLFEIAVFDANDDWVKLSENDDVLGWQSMEDVISWVNKVAVM